MAMAMGDLGRAEGKFNELLAKARDLGDRDVEADTLSTLGALASLRDEPRHAIALHSQSLQAYRALGNRRGEGRALRCLADVHRNIGETRRAIDLLEESLPIFRELGDRRCEYETLESLRVLRGDGGEIGASAAQALEEAASAAQARALEDERKPPAPGR
mmetsp:Transcript_35059/g.110315  ORF Transcript_35059/g.110315 Transcript_35059/m.110315 type:complete len:160 (+) Transcript_35059:351-830(+)